jgi:hypothetical protein
MDGSGRKKSGLAAGWVLVTGLFLICLLGTGLTWWNYTRQVFSSANGVVTAPTSQPAFSENERLPTEPQIAVDFPIEDAKAIRIGHGAIITIGKDTHPLKGRVVSVAPGKAEGIAIVMLRLVNDPGQHHAIPPIGAQCGVTIDTTVPPLDELKSPSGVTPQ